jgi:hypothetical protein
MQQDDEPLGAPIQHPVVLGAHMAAQLAQLSVDLRAMGEWKVRHRIRELVQPIKLPEQSCATLAIKAIDEFPNRLGTVGGTEVNGLEIACHGHPYIERLGEYELALAVKVQSIAFSAEKARCAL